MHSAHSNQNAHKTRNPTWQQNGGALHPKRLSGYKTPVSHQALYGGFNGVCFVTIQQPIVQIIGFFVIFGASFCMKMGCTEVHFSPHRSGFSTWEMSLVHGVTIFTCARAIICTESDRCGGERCTSVLLLGAQSVMTFADENSTQEQPPQWYPSSIYFLYVS